VDFIPRISLLAIAAAALPSAVGAQDSTQAAAAPIVLDSIAVDRWADSVIKPAMSVSGVPGAILVIVQRNRVILNRGYGVSDVAKGTPVDPDVTLFNYASIGKSFTAIIVEQLLGEGVLGLDEDVNRYLRTGHVTGPKVTLRMLLAHRGGFDDDITGLFVPFNGDIRISGPELDRRLHPLVEPGYATAYDNQGFGVIGLVLRDVTGKSIPELYRERLFEPAGMTGAVHGRPADGMARLAHCYTVRGPGEVTECPYWLYRDGLMGAGGAAASGADMARYLRMLLNGGSIDGRTVLLPERFADLIDFDHARFHPGMPGAGRAFVQFEEFRGLEYAHSGHIPGFSSMMKLYPDADVGILFTFLGGTPPSFDLTPGNVIKSLRAVSVRDEAKPGFRALNELTDTFAERFIPADRPRSSESRTMTAPEVEEPLDGFLGRYVVATNHSRSFVSRLGGWMGTISLERTDSGGVRLGGIPALGDYHKVGPQLYENKRGDRLALANSPIGPMMAIGLSGGIFLKTNALESPGWSVPVFLLGFLILLTAIVQRRRKAPAEYRGAAGMALLGLPLLLLGLLAEWQWNVTLAIGDGAILRPLLWRLAIHVGAVMLVWAGIRFLGPGRSVATVTRLHGVLLALAGFGVAVSVVAWRVIGAFPPYFSW
jgi:CubicO group peptidase (beta-lactamase class C family)